MEYHIIFPGVPNSGLLVTALSLESQQIIDFAENLALGDIRAVVASKGRQEAFRLLWYDLDEQERQLFQRKTNQALQRCFRMFRKVNPSQITIWLRQHAGDICNFMYIVSIMNLYFETSPFFVIVGQADHPSSEQLTSRNTSQGPFAYYKQFQQLAQNKQQLTQAQYRQIPISWARLVHSNGQVRRYFNQQIVDAAYDCFDTHLLAAIPPTGSTIGKAITALEGTEPFFYGTGFLVWRYCELVKKGILRCVPGKSPYLDVLYHCQM